MRAGGVCPADRSAGAAAITFSAVGMTPFFPTTSIGPAPTVHGPVRLTIQGHEGSVEFRGETIAASGSVSVPGDFFCSWPSTESRQPHPPKSCRS